jgi:hypothetical protein
MSKIATSRHVFIIVILILLLTSCSGGPIPYTGGTDYHDSRYFYLLFFTLPFCTYLTAGLIANDNSEGIIAGTIFGFFVSAFFTYLISAIVGQNEPGELQHYWITTFLISVFGGTFLGAIIGWFLKN